MGRHTTYVALAAFMSLIVLTPAATGTPGAEKRGGIPNAAGVYASCYDARTGRLRLISTSRRCRKTERRATWSKAGSPGSAGAAGAPSR